MTRRSLLLASLLAACSGEQTVRVDPNPVRHAYEQKLLALDAKAPLPLRFNPAPCNCPAFELQLGERWLRAELSASDADRLNAWTAWLAQTPQDNLPVPVQVRGRLDRDLQRTAQGEYVVRVDVAEILAPLAPQAEPPPPRD